MDLVFKPNGLYEILNDPINSVHEINPFFDLVVIKISSKTKPVGHPRTLYGQGFVNSQCKETRKLFRKRRLPQPPVKPK